MFNFNDIVVDILLEEDPAAGQAPPQGSQAQNQSTANPTGNSTNDAQNIMKSEGFKQLVNAYTVQYGKAPSVTEILKAVNIITGGKYVAAKYTNLGYVPFIDGFAQAYALIEDKNKNSFTQSNIIDIIVKDPAKFDPIFTTIANSLKNTTAVQDYEPSNPDVLSAWRSLTNETNKLSQTAIQSLGSDTIHSAITKIIAKRIPILDRVVGLKGLVKPFNQSVITPILHQFKKYTGYKQGDFKKNPTGWLKDRLWTKKVPNDFSKLVEDVSANNLINVAVLAYEYYIYLLSTQGKPLYSKEQTPAETQMKLPGFENTSLNLFDKFFNSVLVEYNPLPSHYQNMQVGSQQSTSQKSQKARPQQARDARGRFLPKKQQSQSQQNQQQQNQETGGLPPEQIEKIAEQIGNVVDPDYKSFIDEGQSRYLPGIKMDLTTLSKDPSVQAKSLYKALTDMAYFVRPRLSAAQRLGKAATAIGAVRVGMGPVG